MSKFAELINLEEFIVTDTDMLLITEDCLERIAVCEGWVTTDRECGVSSTDICDIASGFRMINLGDFDGFIFACDVFGLEEDDKELYEVLKKYEVLK